MTEKTKVRISYFSDVLCVWAYVSQIRLDELKKQFGDRVEISYHFIPLFGSTDHRIVQGWRDRGGCAGFGTHVKQVCRQFPHVEPNPHIWTRNIPRTSAVSHHFLKAVQLLAENSFISPVPVEKFNGNSLFEEFCWRVRQAFFRDCEDISRYDCLYRIAAELQLPVDEIKSRLENGEAMAAMCRDNELQGEYRVEGSPTYLMNEGRQKLYGNLGYKIIEANVDEILNRPETSATWC